MLDGVRASHVDVTALDDRRTRLPAAAAAHRATFLTHPVFHAHRSETAMLRYLRRLSDMDSRWTGR